ncbi:9656_t:CDS:2 [Scutellospora calospora]|uniref:9656_t:CDS:1 n=1 Tax=Scutellospora calospora TaxID=85575 RepID=A0ACA9KIX3_9GLOM|nr:9656_t:CDS:2 [Scutellospora calospora]
MVYKTCQNCKLYKYHKGENAKQCYICEKKKLEKLRRMKKCKECKMRRNHKDKNAQQCNFCEQLIIKFSGNKIIDDWLASVINKANKFIEFIPFEKFRDISYLAEGGFSKIYKATCINGIKCWNGRKQIFGNLKKHPVVLKSLNNSEIINEHPETKNYMIVMDFAKYGDLHNHISKNFFALSCITFTDEKVMIIIYNFNIVLEKRDEEDDKFWDRPNVQNR